MEPRRIGLLTHSFADWGGGIEFLRIVATSLRYAAPDVELHVLAPMRGPLFCARSARDWLRVYLGLGAVQRVQTNHLADAFAETGAELHLIDLGQSAIARASKRLHLDVLIPAFSPQSSTGTPWVGYISDLQHKRLPQFFSNDECKNRDLAFARMLNEAEVVIVNARDVANDIEKHYAGHHARVFSLPFSPAPASESFTVEVKDAHRRYGIKDPYFIICNQFWKHKDHSTAFEAFAELAKRYPKLSLVCTGATTDFRFPNYYQDLMQTVARGELANRIFSLGMIPKRDQLALLRGAVALIQPTLFEGGPGGGAVYDAVALGKISIVSNIAVNTEIEDTTVTFFQAGNSRDLSEKMEAILLKPSSQNVSKSVLIEKGIERRKKCGNVLLQAISNSMHRA